MIPQHLDVVVIGFFADFYSAGIYRIAKKLVDPINYLIVAFSPWMLNKIIMKKYNFRKLTIKNIISNVIFLLITIYYYLGNQLIKLIAGKEFQESYIPMIILLFGYLILSYITFWTRHYLFLNEFNFKTYSWKIINLFVFIISSGLLIKIILLMV